MCGCICSTDLINAMVLTGAFSLITKCAVRPLTWPCASVHHTKKQSKPALVHVVNVSNDFVYTIILIIIISKTVVHLNLMGLFTVL